MNNLTEKIELLGHIVSFLDDRDAVMFSSCNKFFRNKFPVRRLNTPRVVFPEGIDLVELPDGGDDGGDDFYLKLEIPAIYFPRTDTTSTTRSVRITCYWKTPGEIYQVCQVAILETAATRFRDGNSESSSQPPDPYPPKQISLVDLQQQRHGRLACLFTDHVPGRNWRELALKFTPRRDEKYYLYMTACGGSLHYVQIQIVIVDMPDCSISRNFKILSTLKLIGDHNNDDSNSLFQLQLFQSNVAFLRDMLNTTPAGKRKFSELQRDQPIIDQHVKQLVDVMVSHGILVNDSSLSSIQHLLAHPFDQAKELCRDCKMHVLREYSSLFRTDDSDTDDDDNTDDDGDGDD